MSKQLTVIGMLVVLAFVGCGPSKKQEAAKQQETSIVEMKRIQAAFGDLQIAINAGVSKQEFSQRTNDSLVKIGDLQHSETLAESGFPTARDKVAEIYVHFNRAAEAYKMSKVFFGDEWDDVLERSTDVASVEETETLVAAFPEFSFRVDSSRSRILQNLWKIAKENTEAASGLIDKLATPAS